MGIKVPNFMTRISIFQFTAVEKTHFDIDIDIDIFVNCNWVDTRWQYTFTRNTQNITINNKTTQITNLEECWPCPVFANYTLAFALQLREKHGKTSVRVAREIQSVHIIKTPTHYKTHPHTQTHTHYKTV
jgi:hypothetical protein